MKKIRKGDEVIVITGRDKGKTGIISQVLVSENRLLIDGINLVKKHVKANPEANEKGGIVMKPMPIHASNVMLYDASTQKRGKVGRKVIDGKKVRYFKSTDAVIDV